MVKEYQNKLTNFELPGNKHWLEEVEVIYQQITEKIRESANKYLGELTA